MPPIEDRTIRISESQLDSFGHLNHARYFELFEQSRWDIITERGFGYDVIRRTKTGPVILEASAKFMRELAPREAVVIRSELISYERKVGKMRQQMIKADGAVACEATFTFGLFDMERRRLIDPTPEWAYAVGLEGPAKS
jgi:YbgC/YbaW family acyl-CoA thioester hydrolase